MSGSVRCPYCHERDSDVTDSRWRPPDRRDRRHQCHVCGKRFSTIEIVPTRLRLKALFVKYRLSTMVN